METEEEPKAERSGLLLTEENIVSGTGRESMESDVKKDNDMMDMSLNSLEIGIL